ncbi:MAG TPA: excinuclease ABC subunit C [Flavobacteriaceae bacterium]|jgi:putative endonuclease|nr:excinuclease ABC subunit C [Flavobacteriaceae bacterium]
MTKRAYHNYWVYILTNKPKGTLYIGVTGGLDDRMERHVLGEGSCFTAKYKLKQLVYFEEFQYINDAIAREKQLKNWHRQWKINLIEKDNPTWKNLWQPLDPEIEDSAKPIKFRVTAGGVTSVLANVGLF